MARSPFYPFQSAQARTEYEAHVQEVARLWPVPCETLHLDTPSGQTFVRVSGRVGDPPLFLLPGARVSSLMWYEMVAALSAHHRTYALDIISDVGFSVNRHRISSMDGFTTWLNEVITELVPEGQVSAMGISLGAAIAAHHAVRFPDRLRRVVLLAPAGTVLPYSLGFILRFGWLSIPFPGRRDGALRRTCLWMFDDAVHKSEACRERVEQVIAELEMIGRLFALPVPPWPKVLDDRTWRAFSVPCLYVAGENEKVYSGEAAVRRLNRIAPQVETELIRGAGHDMLFVHPDQVLGKVLQFLES